MLVYALFALGLIGLLFGGDFLVKGAVGLAQRIGISPLIVGLTIVAFGTSAPELLISLDAALGGSGGLAVGNVVGSNVANVLLVLGVPALIAPVDCGQRGAGRTIFFLIGVSVLFVFLMWDGTISRLDAGLLFTLLIVFLVQQGLQARSEASDDLAAELEDEVGDVPQEWWRIAAFTLGGLVLLPVGARLTVDSAVEIAQAIGVTEEVIGLTIVAIGTSLPELATGIMAARQNESSVAIGNVIGSNFFNIAAIMGITGLVVPLPVGGHMLQFDVWVMLAVTALLAVVAFSHYCIGRWTGLALALLYVAYLLATASF